MIKTRAITRLPKIHWKKKDSMIIILILFGGTILSFLGFYYNELYSIFFSICLGLFIGGIFLSIVSTFLAQMESNISGVGELDAEIDVDVDAEIDVDAEVDVDIDYDMGAEIDVDSVEVDAEVEMDAEVDVDSDLDIETEGEIDTEIVSTVTPAPIMLLFSSAFLIFGISGVLLFQIIAGIFRFTIIFISPLAAYFTTKLINYTWKIIAKSRFYKISSTENLIGIEGEVLLPIDDRGGVIKIPSSTPMRFEKVHVKPLIEESHFERGDKIYICDVKNGVLLVDNNRKSIKRR
ncbi:MAG: hypothetical protein ACFFG0_57445 [Candidatus Thorarchaeota archaeon]